MEYKVIEDKDKGAFEAQINDLLKDGWKPLHGVSVLYYEGRRRFYQTMTKEIEPDPRPMPKLEAWEGPPPPQTTREILDEGKNNTGWWKKRNA